ncbi:hypothetical protein HPP92_004394 [Vanilla planifolia]|uniref:VQ domain-containing protein n=1 Tax=Vanilla planifolia TaxID=51239 RepID=A0A835RJE4_VANPL|nr:hypothetical protein HPP92_004812 [Vanilla planifolia]KAG0493400.1 hypothetical protein HPP92_004394 [Vanilla planifolia]
MNRPCELNRIRPPPLQVAKWSHKISKRDSLTCCCSSSSSPSPSYSFKRPKPVIIYTHSPKVIHTSADHFKSLVQKLTGCHHNSPQENAKSCDDSCLEDALLPPLPLMDRKAVGVPRFDAGAAQEYGDNGQISMSAAFKEDAVSGNDMAFDSAETLHPGGLNMPGWEGLNA